MANNMVVSWENALNMLSDLSDKDLYGLCKVCGNNAREWLRKFAVLLIEVSRRGLHRRRGYSSVYEFAAKMVGMNRRTVDKILRLQRVLLDKPVLRLLIGEVGWTKVSVVAGIATAETDGFWADKVKLLPKGALEVYVRGLKEQEKQKIDNIGGVNVDERVSVKSDKNSIVIGKSVGDGEGFKDELIEGNIVFTNQSSQQILSFSEKKSPGGTFSQDSVAETWQMFSFKLSDSTLFKLRLWKQKIEKEKRQSITFNELFEEFFNILDER